MWTVKDGEVGRSTSDAELPIMFCQRHVEFHDVGPTMGRHQSPNKRFSFSTISFPEILDIKSII
jgi:hypothetical protein